MTCAINLIDGVCDGFIGIAVGLAIVLTIHWFFIWRHQ